MTRQVTAGLDGSSESAAAAEWAAREALLREAPLRLVHADERPGWTDDPGPFGYEQRREAHRLLSDVAQRLRRRHPSLKVTTRQLPAPPAEALAAEAAEADLLVLGSRGLGRVMGFVLGSVAMKAITASESPVVLVRVPAAPSQDQGGTEESCRDVVVGVDIRQTCDPLLDFAFEEAARRGSRLRALYGWSLPPLVREASILVGVEQDLAPGVARGLGDALAPWRRKHPSVPVVAQTPIGAPSSLLVRSAADADLVVVGRRGRRSPLGAHIGSVTHTVIHHCTAPVAVVAHH
ncbi:universal stress protein [Streptomyces sp. O3]